MTISPAPAGDPLQEAVRHLNAGAPLHAAAALRRALAADPGHPVALTLMGVTQIETGDLDGAERHLKQALAVSPGRPEILHYLAKAARLSGRPAEAVALCQSALARAPDYDDALVELAAAHVAAGSLEEAIALQRRLIALHPREAGLRRALAATLLRGGRAAEAEQVLLGALALAQDDPAAQADVHSDLADILKTRRAFDAAEAHYAAAARTDRSARPHKGRAAILQHLRRFDEAVEALKLSVARAPLDMDAHLRLNELLFRQGRNEDFLRSYDETATLCPESPVPLVAKGRLLLKVGQTEAASGCFDRALARAPDDLGALVGRARQGAGSRRACAGGESAEPGSSCAVRALLSRDGG